MRKQLRHSYEDIICLENLLLAWQEFIRGKRGKCDVQEFQLRLMDNILVLHRDLVNYTYRHGNYQAFNISDPKPRRIHKASARDRLLHHAIYRILYPFFDRTFIADSYSCRLRKGTHKALNRLREFGGKVSRNNARTCWLLKCDVRKFFASIDQSALLGILTEYIPDKQIVWLLNQVISSFSTSPGKGLPLGNLTSQLFVNIYMNEFDQYVKHQLKTRHYIRYADDFVLLSNDSDWLESLVPQVSQFLSQRLKLTLPDNKILIKTLASGIDFLGWTHFPDHRVLRTATRRRMFKKLDTFSTTASVVSYRGMLNHGNTFKLIQEFPGV